MAACDGLKPTQSRQIDVVGVPAKSSAAHTRLDTSRQAERPSTRTVATGTLTVDIDVHYVTGPDGDAVAARQAQAIAALLAWAGQQRAEPGGTETEEDEEAA